MIQGQVPAFGGEQRSISLALLSSGLELVRQGLGTFNMVYTSWKIWNILCSGLIVAVLGFTVILFSLLISLGSSLVLYRSCNPGNPSRTSVFVGNISILMQPEIRVTLKRTVSVFVCSTCGVHALVFTITVSP